MGCIVCAEEGHDGCIDKMMAGANAVREWAATELAARDEQIDTLRAELEGVREEVEHLANRLLYGKTGEETIN